MLVTPNIMGVAVPMILISVFLFINLSHISYRYGLLFYFNTYDIIMLSHIYLKGVGMSTRMVITIDENLKDLASKKAKNMGLSLSSLVRMAWTKEIKKDELVKDRILREIESSPRISSEEYLAKLDAMIDNA